MGRPTISFTNRSIGGYVGGVNETLSQTNAAVLPERRVITLDEKRGITMAFRRIPPGCFRMGQRGVYSDEEPVHWVEIPNEFWMAETPVTQEQYAVWKPHHKSGFDGKPLHPAENMTWHDAVGYCDWFNGNCRAQLPVGMDAALPSEAEWEYACRAGTRTEYHSGDGKDALEKAGWHDANSGNTTHPVANLEANAWGLFDMHGNVWEWCDDARDDHAYRKQIDGHAAERSASAEPNRLRVLRGGSWGNSASPCRSAFRGRREPGGRDWLIGFRLVLVPGPQAKSSRAEPETGAVVGTRLQKFLRRFFRGGASQ